ncbi:MAG: hypothetical protein KDK33_16710, partial [Leptospiraceae bacterium]|nr:hypothetical protein [Leptospiraceae bacterium]
MMIPDWQGFAHRPAGEDIETEIDSLSRFLKPEATAPILVLRNDSRIRINQYSAITVFLDETELVELEPCAEHGNHGIRGI